jgi:hypothetical protein
MLISHKKTSFWNTSPQMPTVFFKTSLAEFPLFINTIFTKSIEQRKEPAGNHPCFSDRQSGEHTLSAVPGNSLRSALKVPNRWSASAAMKGIPSVSEENRKFIVSVNWAT